MDQSTGVAVVRLTRNLYTARGRSVADETDFEQTADPLLQHNDDVPQQLAETQAKLHTDFIPDITQASQPRICFPSTRGKWISVVLHTPLGA